MQNVMPARSPGMFLPPVEPVPRQRKPHDVVSTESVNAFTPNPSRESFQEARTPPKEEDFILPAELEKQRKAEAKVKGWTIPRKKTPSPVRPPVSPSDHGHHHHLVRSTPTPPVTMSIIDHHQQPYAQSNAMDMSVKRPRNNVEVRRQVLPAKVTWNGEVKSFTSYKCKVIGHFRQLGSGYMFNPRFQTDYLQHGFSCISDWPNDVQSESQLVKDSQWLYGAMESSMEEGIGQAELLKWEEDQDGIRAWIELMNKFDKSGNIDLRISSLENIISQPFSRAYPGGLTKYISDYEAAFVELGMLGVRAWDADEARKRRMIQNVEAAGLTWLYTTAKDKFFSEICFILRDHAQ